jgi:hypothetical protein
MTRTTPKIGDLIEIPTNRGLAYAQETHRHAQWGSLLRVLAGFHAERPSRLEALVRGKEQFKAFFPLRLGLKQRMFTIVGNFPVPEEAQAFPLFKSGTPHPATRRVENWWLWNGERSWQVGQLDEEHRRLPIREIVTDLLLIERIEQGWTSEDE